MHQRINFAPVLRTRTIQSAIVLAAAMTGLAALANGLVSLSSDDVSVAESTVARCDWLAQSTAGDGVGRGDARVARWRRDRAIAFEACMADTDHAAHTASSQ